MGDKLDRVEKQVEKEFATDDWNFHVKLVLKYSIELARMKKADMEIVKLGALLHDIGRARHGGTDHHLTGIPDAEMILKEIGYSDDVIEKVKHIIESHCKSKGITQKTLEAKIVYNADAMAHFDALPFLLRVGFNKEGDIKGSVNWVYEKLQRDWKGLTMPEAKKMTRNKYKASITVLDAVKESMK